jgi:hypothetical protein
VERRLLENTHGERNWRRKFRSERKETCHQKQKEKYKNARLPEQPAPHK